MIPEVTDANFDRTVAEARVPLLVEFWKPGCGGCRALTGELEQLQREVGPRLQIVKMNVEENFQIPAELEIASLPVLALYRGGAFERFIGGIGKKDAIRSQVGV